MRLSPQAFSHPPVRVRPGDLSPDARAAWLYLRDQGGWHTADELALGLMPGAPLRSMSKSVVRWMVALVRRGHAAQHPSGGLVKRYGVTTRCFPIPGESLDPAELPTPAHQA